MKPIDKDKIVAEIERLRKNQMLGDRHDQGVLDGLHAIEKFIDTLEVNSFIEQICRWLLEHGMTQHVIERYRKDMEE